MTLSPGACRPSRGPCSLRGREGDGMGGETPPRAPVRGGGGGPAYSFPDGGRAGPSQVRAPVPVRGWGHSLWSYLSGFSCGFMRFPVCTREVPTRQELRESVSSGPGGEHRKGGPDCSPTLPDCSAPRSCVQGPWAPCPYLSGTRLARSHIGGHGDEVPGSMQAASAWSPALPLWNIPSS